jgi:hypothetical protein
VCRQAEKGIEIEHSTSNAQHPTSNEILGTLSSFNPACGVVAQRAKPQTGNPKPRILSLKRKKQSENKTTTYIDPVFIPGD